MRERGRGRRENGARRQMSEETRDKKVKTKKSYINYHNAAIFCIIALNLEIIDTFPYNGHISSGCA